MSNDVDRPVKIQIVSRYLPVENTHGSATHMLDFIRYLRRMGFEVSYVLLGSPPNGVIPWYVIPSAVRSVANVAAINNLRVGHVLFTSLSQWIIAILRVIYGRLPESVRNICRSVRKRLRQVCNIEHGDASATPKEIAFARIEFSKFQPDVVVADYVWLGNVLDALSRSVLKVIFVHDIPHRVIASFSKAGVHSAYPCWDWEKESTQLRKAQVLLALQEEDAAVLRGMASECEIIRISMSAVYHPHDPAEQVHGRCLYVGSGAPENVTALQWFLENVWPIVLDSVLSHCSLHVCGNVCNGIQGVFPNVHFLGRVDDLGPEYGAAEVCLVPHFISGGVKIKLVDALSHGRACVSTSCGVDGLLEVVGKAVIVADTAEDFATAVCMILTNPDKRRRIEEEARKFVAERLSPEVVYRPFVDRVYEHIRINGIALRGNVQ